MTEQLTERYCVLVNGHAVEPGCWVDGHWGQYGPDHLADRASELGWEARHVRDDPRRLRRVADWLSDRLPPEPFCKHCRVPVFYDRDDGCWRHMEHEGETCGSLSPDTSAEPSWASTNIWECRVDASDRIENWLNEHTPPLCPECGQPMHAGSDGFYFHDGLPCTIRATLDPIVYSWGWHDGEFYLWPTETWEEDA